MFCSIHELKSFLSAIFEPSMILTTGIFTLLATKITGKNVASYNRLMFAYHPIFMAAEPNLFKEIKREEALIFLTKY